MISNYKNIDFGICLICDKPSGKNILCKECYDTYLEHFKNFKNRKHSSSYNLWFYENKPLEENLAKLLAYLDVLEDNELIGETTSYFLNFKKYLDSMDDDMPSKHKRNLRFKCKDGHIVRSKSEMQIDNYLYDHNIKHAYEKAYPIDNNPENDLFPDFYLPDYDLYIEHWGMEKTPKGNFTKEYKLNIYKQDKTTIISTHESDMADIETNLSRKLKYFKKNETND